MLRWIPLCSPRRLRASPGVSWQDDATCGGLLADVPVSEVVGPRGVMKTLTIAICSYQRRGPLVRLLEALALQASQASTAWAGVELVVAVDGSTDGSELAARAVSSPLPTTVIQMAHAGLSAARNVCLEHASGEVIYFLDDDLVPANGTVELHRYCHEQPGRRVVLGPCVIPAEIDVPAGVRAWWERRYEELAAAGTITRFDQFSIANASGPTAAFREVGGFDQTFIGYGLEDHELGLRLQAAGTIEIFDPAAVAWHFSQVDMGIAVERARQIGRNSVRLLRMHPGVESSLFYDRYQGPATWLLDVCGLTSARWLGLVSAVARRSAASGAVIPRRLREELWAMASAAALAAGVAELDRALVARSLGRPSGPTSGHLWRRVPMVTGADGVNSAR